MALRDGLGIPLLAAAYQPGPGVIYHAVAAAPAYRVRRR